jgi:hypothetical protein
MSSNNNNNNNIRFSFNNNEIYIINMFNTMYTNNSRLIDQLVTSNNEIRIMIQNILHQNIQNNTNRHNRNNQRNPNVRQSYSSETNANDNYSSILLSTLFPDYSYVVDYIQPIQTDTFMDPVPIYPTQEQIDNATSALIYGEIVNPLNHSCPISLEPFHENDRVVMIKHCSHIFKPEEIQSWFQSNVRCPVCRYDIRNYQDSSSRVSRQQQQNVQRQSRTTSQERNNRRNQSLRILQRGETLPNSELFNNLVTSIWNNAFVAADASNNLL